MPSPHQRMSRKIQRNESVGRPSFDLRSIVCRICRLCATMSNCGRDGNQHHLTKPRLCLVQLLIPSGIGCPRLVLASPVVYPTFLSTLSQTCGFTGGGVQVTLLLTRLALHLVASKHNAIGSSSRVLPSPLALCRRKPRALQPAFQSSCRRGFSFPVHSLCRLHRDL